MPNNDRSESVEERLQVEVMEDYLLDAEGLSPGESKNAYMRDHYQKLLAFIKNEKELSYKEGKYAGVVSEGNLLMPHKHYKKIEQEAVATLKQKVRERAITKKKDDVCFQGNAPGMHYECDCPEKVNFNEGIDTVLSIIEEK